MSACDTRSEVTDRCASGPGDRLALLVMSLHSPADQDVNAAGDQGDVGAGVCARQLLTYAGVIASLLVLLVLLYLNM
ncbi:hypothetical protein GPOL_c40480 [Gordonia polyisoprenivorans VH2]|uniref:Uncharacterized protein n=2 Tax=Gordonia polyisoprenivorans TaxID=84595 RepID=H6MS42_GORPV|nr:hypothetical protein GPOL_c40480 [Gordonia polyisoprenivorans VH2]